MPIFFSVYICCCVIALQLESSSSKKNRSKKTRRANARCSLPRERERERKNERKGERRRQKKRLFCVSFELCASTQTCSTKKLWSAFSSVIIIYHGFLVVLWRSAFDVPLLLFLEQTFNDGKEWCFVYHGFVIFPLQRPRLSVRVHSFRLLPRLRVDQRRRSRVVRPRDDRTG